jgi:hypothetical protein
VQGAAAPQIASQPADGSEGPSGVPMFSFVQSVFTHGGDPFVGFPAPLCGPVMWEIVAVP